MDQCYINLAIVQEPSKTARHAEKGSGETALPYTSFFSLTARLNVETPDENIQMELPSLFDSRKDPNGESIEPRRIFIRGRAGVGKTTLCKKMVSRFSTDEFCK
jgi:Cdc6-like AAA superfamily ATPase